MMLFTTVDIPKAQFDIPHSSKVLLLGSCFADEVGTMLVRGGFDALVNPFGTLYNPASIAALLTMSLNGKVCDTESLVFRDDIAGVWHSWLHHSRFSAPTKDALLGRMNDVAQQVGDVLRTCDVMIVTLGTSIIYRMKEDGLLVANCHKQPDNLFVRQRMGVGEIVTMWQDLLRQLAEVNPRMHIIFTVSPIRHKRDEMHVNQISKGILLQAVDELLQRTDSQQCVYFPAYEIMLDELRDYRFYADDMIHPSPLAVDYIYHRFQDTYFSNKTKDAVAKATKAWRQSQHREIIK